MNGFFFTVVSDFLWAQSVLYTSPLIATLGLTLNIPLAMLYDAFAHGKHFGIVYIMGSLLVFCGFVAVNWKFSKRFDPSQAAAEAAEENLDSSTPTSILSSAPASSLGGNRHDVNVFTDADEEVEPVRLQQSRLAENNKIRSYS